MTNEVKNGLQDAIRNRIKRRPAVDMGQGSREASFKMHGTPELGPALKVVSERRRDD
jgi:hypothetical protein